MKIMQRISKKMAYIAVFAVASLLISGNAAKADNYGPPPDDTRVTAYTVTPVSGNFGATTDYDVSFTLNTALSAQQTGPINGIQAMVSVNYNNNCSGGEWTACLPNFSNAGVSGSDVTIDPYSQGQPTGIQFLFIGDLAAGTHTFTITNVVNPSFGGGYYSPTLTIMSNDVQPGEGESWPQKNGSAFLLGLNNVLAYGQVLKPNDQPLVIENGGIGVNVHTQDYSFNGNGGADQNGYFAIPQSAGVSNGMALIADINVPSNSSGMIAPDPINLTYNGTAINLGVIHLTVATKTITGRVTYDTGGAVSTASVSAYKGMGGGGVNANTDEDGNFELSLSGGQWNLNLSPAWDQETQQQVSADWNYNQSPTQITFQDNNTVESDEINFVVQKTDAVIKGKAVLPNGTPFPGGSVNVNTGSGQGNGSGINPSDGKFEAHVKNGTYNVSIFGDQQNPLLAQYYFDQVTVTVGPDQTLDLGTFVAKTKNSSISGTVSLENGEPVADLTVNCWAQGGTGWGNAQTSADGTYSLPLTPGNWQCEVQTNADSNYFPVRMNGPKAAYTLADDQAITGVDFTVKEANGHISVRLIDTDGNALNNVWGYAYARVKDGGYGPDSEYGTGINGGIASIPLMGDKTYVVGVSTSSDQVGLLLDEELEVYVAENETTDAILTMVAPDATIKGFIKDQSGNLVTGVDIDINAMPGGKMMGSGGMHTMVNKANGSFTIPVRGGDKYTLGYWAQNNSDFIQTPSNEQPFTVSVNGTVTKVITIYRADSQVNATLLNPDGSKVDWGYVFCSNRKEKENQVQADVEGQVIVDSGSEAIKGKAVIPLIAGNYECGAGQSKAGEENMPPEMVSVDVAPDSPADITLQFREADAHIKGNITREDGEDVNFGWCHAWQPQGGFSGGEAMNGTFTIPLTIGNWYVGCDTYNPGTGDYYRSEEQYITISEKGDINQDFVLAKADFTIPEGATATWDNSQESKVITLPDGTVLSVPAGALSSSGSVTVTASPNTNIYSTSDTQPLNFAWGFEALDSSQNLITSFNSAVTITIPYNQEYLDSKGLNENNLVAKYYDTTAGTWKLPDGVSQDAENNTITFTVTHFTDFALTTGQYSGVAGQQLEGASNLVATPMSSGGPQVGVYDKDGNLLSTWFAFSSSMRMGLKTVQADLDGNGQVEVIAVPGEGYDSQIRIFDKNGNILTQFMAYAAGYRKGIKLAVYDVDGDSKMEIITVPASEAAADVKVFSKDGDLLSRFNAFGSSFTKGAEIAVTDIDGDGKGEIVAYPTNGSGQVRVFSKDGNALSQFNTYGATYRKGINLTLNDLDGNGTIEIIITPKDSAGHVKVFSKDGDLLAQFMAYASTFKGGAKIYTGDVDGDGAHEIVALPANGGSAQARVFDKDGNLLSQFFAYPSAIRGSFTAVVADLDDNGKDEIAFAPGADLGPQVRVFDKDGGLLSQFFALNSNFRGGLNLSAIAK